MLRCLLRFRFCQLSSTHNFDFVLHSHLPQPKTTSCPNLLLVQLKSSTSNLFQFRQLVCFLFLFAPAVLYHAPFFIRTETCYWPLARSGIFLLERSVYLSRVPRVVIATISPIECFVLQSFCLPYKPCRFLSSCLVIILHHPTEVIKGLNSLWPFNVDMNMASFLDSSNMVSTMSLVQQYGPQYFFHVCILSWVNYWLKWVSV